jgi:hypothetical protein
VEAEHLDQLLINLKQLVLQDYVVAKWTSHVASVRSLTRNLPEHVLKEFARAVELFCERFESLDTEKPTDQDFADCSLLAGDRAQPDLAIIWSHIRVHNAKDIKVRDTISLGSLSMAVERNRKRMEEIANSTNKHVFHHQKALLTSNYGQDIFKCSKISCYWFYAGFKDKKTRDRHERRHNRPFVCNVPHCSKEELGFITNQDLEKHRREFHPDPLDLVDVFLVERAPQADAKFPCSKCDKRFTRKANLDAHLLNHAGERPYACSICGKEFTRANDRRRHEKTHDKKLD